jgi:hypothetical protein
VKLIPGEPTIIEDYHVPMTSLDLPDLGRVNEDTIPRVESPRDRENELVRVIGVLLGLNTGLHFL